MKNFILILCATFVTGLAYWAYGVNYTTQAAQKRIKTLQKEIAAEQEALTVLNAEWAYLNRPERLRELADMNFERLQLVPLTGGHFSETEKVAFPEAPEVLDIINEPVLTQNTVGAE